MNKQLTEIVFILDRSGSMAGTSGEAIAGFNEFLRQQQAAPGRTWLTLVFFDDEYLVPADHLPVAEVLPLNSESYVPRSCTALLDAIGLTIDRVGDRLAKTAEVERPGKVIMAILTDGLENSSRYFNWKDVFRRIRHQTKQYQWEFLFLGANQDAIAMASNLGIRAHNTSSWVADSVGITSTAAAIGRKTSALRGRACEAPLSSEEGADFEKPLSHIVAEEDRKRRKE